MRLMVCGSMRFAKQMLDAKQQLQRMGHEALVPVDTELFAADPAMSTDDHEGNYRHCIDNDIVRRCLEQLAASDAILVLNLEKNGVSGHIGANSLIEIGLAYYLKKKIFLLHAPPSVTEEKSTHEVLIMQPVVLDGDLSRLQAYA